MKRITKASLIATAVTALLLGYTLNRAATVWLDCQDTNFLLKIEAVSTLWWSSICARPFYFDLRSPALLAGSAGILLVLMAWIYYLSDTRQFMAGAEHGSAQWGTKRDIDPLIDHSNPDNNLILSATEQITMGKPKNFEFDRNKNVCYVGGSGSGKTYSAMEPNMLQLHSSYIITDPKGTLLPETGFLFTENGYKLRSFNVVDFSKSMHYNPLAYISSAKDILKVVNVLITNTNSQEDHGGDPFWEKSERLLYAAIIGYLYEEAPMTDRNIPTMIDLLDVADVREEDEEYQSPLDIIFGDLEAKKPDCFAVRQYRKFRKAAGKTMKSILISCAARLSPFDIPELREIMRYDELNLDKIGEHKTALFVIMSDTDSTFSFVVAMLMYQAFNLLCETADTRHGGKLPVHVRFLLDEFANIGKIPDFQHLIAVIRSRNVSATIALQSLSQLKPVYKDDAETIIDNCDSLVFLGGKSTKTTEELAKMVGKTTISNRNASETKGSNSSYSLQDQILGRDLIDPAEIGKLKRSMCLVIITGLPPFKSQKYNTKGHKRYSYLHDSGNRPSFDISAFRAEEQSKHFFDNINLNASFEVNVDDVDLSELNEL